MGKPKGCFVGCPDGWREGRDVGKLKGCFVGCPEG